MALVFAALSLQPALVRAQVTKRLSRAAVDSLLNPALSPEADKIIAFDAVTKDIGDIKESDSVRTVRFTFRNVSGKPLTITRVTTHCGCTVASFGKQPVAAGDSSVITVQYNPKGRAGTIDTNAFVYVCGAGSRPVAKLTILGNVVNDDEWSHLPVVMGCLRTKRRSVVFEPLKGGTEPQQRIPCVNVGKDSVRLSSSILPSYARLSTEPSVIAPGEEADIIITIVGSVLPKELPGSFNIVLDGIGGPLRDRTIKVTLNR